MEIQQFLATKIIEAILSKNFEEAEMLSKIYQRVGSVS